MPGGRRDSSAAVRRREGDDHAAGVAVTLDDPAHVAMKSLVAAAVGCLSTNASGSLLSHTTVCAQYGRLRSVADIFDVVDAGSRRVVLVGDSFWLHLEPAVWTAARASGLTVLSMVDMRCAPTFGPRWATVHAVEWASRPGCSRASLRYWEVCHAKWRVSARERRAPTLFCSSTTGWPSTTLDGECGRRRHPCGKMDNHHRARTRRCRPHGGSGRGSAQRSPTVPPRRPVRVSRGSPRRVAVCHHRVARRQDWGPGPGGAGGGQGSGSDVPRRDATFLWGQRGGV